MTEVRDLLWGVQGHSVKLTGPRRSAQDTASWLVMGAGGGCSGVTLGLL